MKPKTYIFVCIFAFVSFQSFAQVRLEHLKRQAIVQMQAGNYGEAINLLNRYIASRPRKSEGYNLRGLCYENRTQYRYAVFDFRRALKLEPNNSEARKNLDRTIKIWYALLHKRIKGFKREIAINPSNPFNYLEIGKSYRWLEQWSLAESWYDKFLARYKNASPDEIIRYTIILTKTGHIKKGEKILKKYVQRYPDDWRLWSRYGYFTLWLGKYQIAKKAFLKALSFKPFFQEAEDGLDLAKHQAYVTLYSQQDYERGRIRTPREYPIDRYYRIVRNNPNNDKIRFKLIKNLITAKRFEEAYQQINFLTSKYKGTALYNSLYNKINSARVKYYGTKIIDLMKILKEDPQNAKVTRKIAEYYSSQEKYNDAEEILSDYLNLVPNDVKIRFLYAKILTYDRRLNQALSQIDTVMAQEPNITSHKLLAGELRVWKNKDLDQAAVYLEDVVKKEPKNIYAWIALGTLNFQRKRFVDAKNNMEEAALINPTNKDLEQLKSMLNAYDIEQEQDSLVTQLNIGRKLAKNKNCEEAIPYYREYINKIKPDKSLLLELASVYVCAKEFDNAIQIYNNILKDGYDSTVDKQRAKVIFWSGDSLSALNEFERLVKKYPNSLEMQLYLGDTYAKLGKYKKAAAVYSSLKKIAPKSYMINQRINWLPEEYRGEGIFKRSLRSISNYLFSYTIFSPIGYFFRDNLSFEYYYGGSQLEIGFLKFLSLGASWYRGIISNRYDKVYFTTFKGNVFIRPINNLVISLGYGKMFARGIFSQPVIDASLNYSIKDKFKLNIRYLKTDGSVLLYSPFLVNNRLTANMIKLEGKYNFSSGLNLYAYYNLVWTIKSGLVNNNIGNTWRMKIGKRFYPFLNIGYEYEYIDFKYNNALYYSPQMFSSHNLWADWLILKNKRWNFALGGKLGYVPSNDYIIRQLNAELSYKIFNRLKLLTTGFIGNSIRNSVAYSSGSIYLNLFWTLY